VSVERPAISVCIATCERPAGIASLLRSLSAQDAATPPFEIIVVDNDATGSARDAADAATSAGLRLSYVVEPVRNIARARNRGLAMATAPLVAFIDDDETAAPDWLRQLHEGLLAHDADGAFGKVEAVFAAAPPDWLRAAGFFIDPPIRGGALLPWNCTRTSNALVKRSAFDGDAGHFDESFGQTGGEDCALFRSMIMAGRRLVAVPDAVVFEHLPDERLHFAWLLARHFRNGSINYRITRHSARPGEQPGHLAGDMLHLAWRSLRAALALGHDPSKAARKACDAAFFAGRIAMTVGYCPRPYAAKRIDAAPGSPAGDG
jgi:succinoglycan biosynthesis protein ExoM